MKKGKDVKLTLSGRAMGILSVLPYRKRNRLARIRKNVIRELKALSKELARTREDNYCKCLNDWVDITF